MNRLTGLPAALALGTIASRKGSAIVAPIPRSTVRRDNDFAVRKFIFTLVNASGNQDSLRFQLSMRTSGSFAPPRRGRSFVLQAGHSTQRAFRARNPSVSYPHRPAAEEQEDPEYC